MGKSHSVKSFIYTSSTSVYPEDSGAWVEENSLEDEAIHSDVAQILRRAENLIEKSIPFRTYFILRLSGICRPATLFIESNSVIQDYCWLELFHEHDSRG